jgi:hypothetical protein
MRSMSLLRNDMGMGKPVIMCHGYGFEFAEPMQHHTHFHDVMGMHGYSSTKLPVR